MAKSVPAKEVVTNYSNMTRKSFPEGFVFGTGTSAYQVEGAASSGGRGVSVWDDFTLRTPYRISDGSNGNLAVDMYYRYKEDIRMMKSMGFDAYRFSISWPRLIPSGKICLGVNREGIDYYNDLINTLLDHGIKPHVTLFHWDLPDALQKEYGGFLSDDIVDDYCDYVNLCFWEFGDRVKHWATFNEPWTYCYRGYVARNFPPGKKIAYGSAAVARGGARPSLGNRTVLTRDNAPIVPLHDYRTQEYIPPPTVNVPITSPMRALGITENSSSRQQMSEQDKEAFIAARNMILAHGAAIESYNRKFKDQQGGEIGIALNIHWFEPLDDTNQDDIDAARRVHDFKLGWFLEPVLTGQYPKTMRKYVPREALFTEDESDMLKKNKIDFLGVNYYTARYVQNYPQADKDPKLSTFDKCQHARILVKDKNGKDIGPCPGASWLYVVPWGIKNLLKRINEYYNDSTYNIPPVYITENGVAETNDHRLTACDVANDKTRVNYYRDHLGNIMDVINEMKCEVKNCRCRSTPCRCHPSPKKLEIKGFFAWSWVDNFEWASGYGFRFGVIYIDYMNNLKRYPKQSAIWFSQFLAGKVPKLLPEDEDEKKEY